MAPVDLVTIHHEGSLANGGAPTDDVARFSEGGYCYGIGATLWERFRAPADNWATLNFNGEDLTLCFSGDHHTGTRLTDTDLELLHGAFVDCYNRGEVTAEPLVRAHRNSPGSSTACPGDYTIDRWADVEAACRPGKAPPPTPEPDKKAPDMIIIERSNPKRPANEQPYAFLDADARKVWSYYGFEIAWEGGQGDSVLHGDTDPKWIGIPGSAKIIGWGERGDGKVVAYGNQGAQYIGDAHG